MFRAPDTHQITWPIRGKKRGDFAGHLTGHGVRFADRQATDRVARKIKLKKLLGALPAQVGEGRALHDTELRLRDVGIAGGKAAEVAASPSGPCGRAGNRGLSGRPRSRSFNTFVQNHGNVRTKGELDLARFFRSKEML